MSQIGLARQAFAKVLQRVPGGNQVTTAYLHFPGNQVVSILESQVVPAITAIAKTPGFQALVSNGIDPLLPGAGTPARKMIEAYQSEVRACCAAMQTFIASHADLLSSHIPVAGSRYMRLLAPLGKRESVDTISRRVTAVKDRSEEEWVWAEDFFGPVHGTFLDDGCKVFQSGEFVVSLSDELTYTGNIVARCLLVRAGSARRCLQEVDGVLQASSNSAQCRDPMPWKRHLKVMAGILQNLSTICLCDSDAVLAESATALVQILLEFSASPPETPWLPVPIALRSRHAGQICHALRSQRDAATAERILDAIRTIEIWWESRPSTLTALEEAIASGGGVLDTQRHELYWAGKRVPVPWRKKPKCWAFLLALARSRGNHDIDWEAVYSRDERARGYSALSTLKNRVLRDLPPELRGKITPGPETGTYRLDLQAKDVHVV
jgi:hypothetical protein